MCARCKAAQKSLENNAERIEELIQGALNTLAGNYSEDIRQTIEEEPFPKDKTFLEKIFQLSSAAMQLVTAQALIEGGLPSEVLMGHVQVALQGESEAGLHQISVMPITMGNAEQLLSALLGGMPTGPDDDEPTYH